MLAFSYRHPWGSYLITGPNHESTTYSRRGLGRVVSAVRTTADAGGDGESAETATRFPSVRK